MKFLADECVEWQIVEALRKDGHSVFYVVENDRSIPDEEVLNTANSESAILIPADKDFGEMVYQQKRIPVGVILIRLAGLSNALN
jgi:predicted nuclease of predicted toxin-antitoxin system